MSDNATLRWCSTHGYPALVYADGSAGCWWEDVVEMRAAWPAGLWRSHRHAQRADARRARRG